MDKANSEVKASLEFKLKWELVSLESKGSSATKVNLVFPFLQIQVKIIKFA